MTTDLEQVSEPAENLAVQQYDAGVASPPHHEITPAQARVESVAAVLHAAYAKASTLQLTPEEAEALSADFPDEAFELGAGGKPDLLYLSHVYLRQRLNKVLGIGSVVPIRRREWSEEFTYQKDGRQKRAARVYVDLVLVVRGCVVGEAIGDATFYIENANDSYSDTLEKAKSNAFRRCCKEFGVGLQPWMKGWCEEWKQRNRGNRSGGSQNARTYQQDSTPRQYQKPAPQANQERKPATPADVLPQAATPKRRDDVVAYLAKQFGAEAMGTFYASRQWDTNWPLGQVPANNTDLAKLVDEIKAFNQNLQCPPSDGVSTVLDTATDNILPPEIGETVISVPRKGMKRDQYMSAPDTIQSLYSAMKAGDAEAQRRLWGLAKSFVPESWIDGSGKKRPPSQDAVDCRIGLDMFLAWHDDHEKNEGQDGDPQNYGD